MELQNSENHLQTSLLFQDTPPVYTNISLQFTGIGHLVIYGNSLISFIEKKFNLKIENLPLHTYKHAFWFIFSNLKSSGFDVITIFYEEEENLHKKVVLEYLKSLYPYHSVSDFSKYIKNERVALVIGDLSRKSREFLFKCALEHLYFSVLDKMDFIIPFVYAFVYVPVPMKGDHEQKIDFFKDEKECIFKNVSLPSSLSKFKIQMDDLFINDKPSYPNFEAEISEEICLFLLGGGLKTLNFDGRVLFSKPKKDFDFTSGPLLPNTLIKKSIPEQMELDLLVNFKQINSNSSMIHFKNIQRSAMSLFNGRLLFSPIIRETGKTKPLKISKKQQAIIEESEKRIKAKEEEQDKLWLRNFYTKYLKLSQEGKKSLLENVNPDKPSLYRRILLLKIEYYSEIWKLELHSENADERLLIPCYSNCIKFVDRYQQTGDPHLEFVLQTLIDCGFEATVHEIIEKMDKKSKPNLKFYTDDTSAPSDYDICFQLKYMGDKLKRSLGSKKDKRVLFEPDGWQIKLLDLVDQNKSAVVAAPTSSGKTFICFYAIEKILRESDDNMVIFCLPTKALANQVSADIYARFSPKLNCKTNIQGFLMKDNANDPFNCQVLITIPSLLESILNSPPTKGLRKIKYIIIDEVHKISSEEMGAPIERIFHLSPCPLLVLSATLGNLEGFYGWMKAIENSKGRECELVFHKERYCELKPFVYKDNDKDNLSSIIPINNLFAYSYEHIRKFGFGDDINFLPEELLELFDTLCKVLTEEQKELLYPLVPENFFKSNIITKKDCKTYESHLLHYFQGLIKDDLVSEKQIKAVYKLLTRESRKAFEKEYIDEEYISENIIDLLTNLKDQDMLPCIVFNTDRDFVNRLAVRVYEKLEALDSDVKKNKAIEKMKKESKRTRDVEKGKDSWIEESILAERSFELKDDRKNIKYTFLDPATKISDYELQEETKYIKNTPYEFIDMMYRGIGVHHEQMNRRYRNVAEILFRKKHIRVLFATDTLALGINMPCRSVVFAGDSLLLDPLNYKQMAGRAGRRGYDTLGNVVFMGIPQRRVQNLMVSRLPNIKGVYTYTNSSFIGFDIKESLVKYPLLESTFYGGMTKTDEKNSDSLTFNTQILNLSLTQVKQVNQVDLCNSKHFYDLHNIFLDLHKRKELVDMQMEVLSSFFGPDSYLNELIISNRDTDPSIFIFVLLVQSGLLDYEPSAFMNTLAHIFEVRPLLFPSDHTLPPLNSKIHEFCTSLNDQNIKRISSFYSPALLSLQEKCSTPLHNILSFLQCTHLDSPKNSYILDFFKHNNVKRIRTENNIRSADLFKSLSVINTVFTSLIRWHVKYDLDKEVLRKIQNIYSIFEPKFKGIFA